MEADTIPDATLTAENQSTAIAGIQRFPPTNKEIAQWFRASLQQLIFDAAKQWISLSTTEGLTSPHQLDTPDKRQGRLHSVVVHPTPDAPLKNSRTSTERLEILSKKSGTIENPGKIDTLPGSTNPIGQSKTWAGQSDKHSKEINRCHLERVINTLTRNAKKAQSDCMV